ncbi:Rab-like GTPase [Pithovirus sibericum]|uniref:Rab-like GTPase n=1 Tax=Pithovirus sibericum TaxID=1450746 RepID=W5SAJ0_9VIRU|nr:Rab-like GTPase [Pithovirus sibericum]AHH01780.1 Rab-like GTPase [Pithovirus sibericum]
MSIEQETQNYPFYSRFIIPNKRPVRVALVGNSDVGKSTFFLSLRNGNFVPNVKKKKVPLICQTFQIVDERGREIDVQCIDFPGSNWSPEFSQYLKICDGALIFYDLTKLDSFANLPVWHNLVESFVGKNIVFVGTRCSRRHRIRKKDRINLQNQTQNRYQMVKVCSENCIKLEKPFLQLLDEIHP